MNTVGKRWNCRHNALAVIETLRIRSPQSRAIIGFCLFVTAYYLAYYYGMFFTRTAASPFWFPDSVLLCALLMAEPRRWWIFILALLPIRFVVPLNMDLPMWFKWATLAIDAAKGILIAIALRRFIRNPLRLQTVHDYAVYCLFAVLLVPAINAFPGGWVRYHFGFPYRIAWEQWFLGDALAHLIVTPALLFLVSGLWRNRPQPAENKQAELGLVTMGLLVTSWIEFHAGAVRIGFDQTLFYAPLLFLFWAAIRFGMFGASGATTIMAFLAVATAISGKGIFADRSPDETALALQHFLVLRAAPIYLVAILMEQKKQAEAETQKQRAELALVSRVSTMGLLASALAHEINQPLCAILRNAEAGELILRQQQPDYEELRAILVDIRADDQRASTVINRMRSFLQRRQLELEPLSAQSLIEQVAVLMRPELMVRRIALHVDTPADLPAVSGDRVHLQQVLINLLMNGADAMNDAPTGRRQLYVRAARADGGMVEVSVRDSGHGIPEQKLKELFEPFFTTKTNGMGMGLAISKTIVESHGGRIWAENNPQGGATLRFTLRIAW
jgi:signal transduction histidine kinase